MTEYTRKYLEAAKRFLAEHTIPHMQCAFAGGSVGRGEADQYSDLDLNVYVANEVPSQSRNIRYGEVIIQLHLHQQPNLENIYQHPWEYRFLAEGRVVYDPDGEFEALKYNALNYFRSAAGRGKMWEQARAVIQERTKWFKESIGQDYPLDASIAVFSTFIDAALAYAYFIHDVLASDKVLPLIRVLDVYEQYKKIGYPRLQLPVLRALDNLSFYRSHLHLSEPREFPFEPIQDELIQQKVHRLIHQGENEELALLLYSEAVWLYLSAAGNRAFDEHVKQIPADLSTGIQDMGLVTLTHEEMERFCQMSEELVMMVDIHLDRIKK